MPGRADSEPAASIAGMLKRSLAALAAMSLLSLAACSDDDGERDDNSSSASATCTYTADGTAPAKDVEPPATEPDKSGLVPASIRTSAGDIKVLLDAKNKPCTVNSFLSLASQGYFDGTNCHRITTEGNFILQCGDPTGTGMGGPGYAFDDELTGDETYPAGTLAMANAGPDTNGSQFFLVYRDSDFQPDYTVFGTIDPAGLKVLESIAKTGTLDGSSDGPPADPVLVNQVAG